eukprot:Skav203974  [mRNA]  locus=scaffold94:604620:613758:+ [translate_table: standard]
MHSVAGTSPPTLTKYVQKCRQFPADMLRLCLFPGELQVELVVQQQNEQTPQIVHQWPSFAQADGTPHGKNATRHRSVHCTISRFFAVQQPFQVDPQASLQRSEGRQT